MFVVFANFLEGREVVCNGVQIRGVERQKEQRGSSVGNECLSFCAFVEGDGVPDHDMGGGQERTAFLFQPSGEDGRVTGALKQERGGKGFPDPGGKQRRARPALSSS